MDDFVGVLCRARMSEREAIQLIVEMYRPLMLNPVYLGYDLEMRQLCRIKQELLWRPSVSIVCMDYQAEIIREYLGEKVIIYELNTENVMKYLINDIGE